MVGMPMVVADLPALREVLRADGAELVAFVPPHDTEGWISAIRAALAALPSPQAMAIFASAICRKYSRQQMIEKYLGLFGGPPAQGRKRSPPLRLSETAEEMQP
jgi:glycosyltransferase involved in cell wall biosynthesis